jgi:hypothetical protein
MARSYLTHEQIWTIITAPESVSSASMAREFGVSDAAVKRARILYRSQPWTCRVDYAPCDVCGLPMTRRGWRAMRQRYHPECRPVALKKMGAVHHQARMARTPETARNEMMDRLHEWDDEGHRQSRAVAINHLKRWTPAEDVLVLDHPGKSDLDVALSLGRSLRAVKRRKHYLTHGN